MEEFPSFNIVGEVWLQNSIPATAYWQDGMVNADGYKSYLPTVTDFPLCFTVPQALNEPGSWDTGMRRLYNVLSQDFLYPDANRNMVFLDNHDLTRYFLLVKKDMRKFKMGLAFLLTTRGIPQLYYGTELLMDGDGGHHPNVRLDFPGGWAGDAKNAFVKEGRTAEQNEAFDFMRKLLQWRQREEVIHEGKLTHYIPEDNIYVYFRYNDDRRIMVIMNANDSEKRLDTALFQEDLKGFTRGKDVVSAKEFDLVDKVSIPSWDILILILE
jgi:glycosidase